MILPVNGVQKQSLAGQNTQQLNFELIGYFTSEYKCWNLGIFANDKFFIQ